MNNNVWEPEEAPTKPPINERCVLFEIFMDLIKRGVGRKLETAQKDTLLHTTVSADNIKD